MKLTFIEHACVMLEDKGTTIVIDPFTQNISNVLNKYPGFMHPDFILLTHGHEDHTASLGTIVGKNTKIVGIVELCSHLEKESYKNTFGMNFGGTLHFENLSVSLVPAVHSSADKGIYLGEPAGFIIRFGGQTIYHAGDTALFSDMKLINRLYHPTIGLIPIGGRFTMDEETASICCNEYFSFETVVPIHYNTFPPIVADAKKFQSLTNSKTIILNPLDSINFDN